MDEPAQKILERYRTQISDIDRQIFTLVKKRELLSEKIGRTKQRLAIPLRDFAREKEVFSQTIDLAAQLDLSPSFAIDLQKLIIEASLTCQEQDRIKNSVLSHPKSVLIIGGAGRLGSWLGNFFRDSGHRVSVLDKRKAKFSCTVTEKLDETADRYDIIIVATPIRISIDILQHIDRLDLINPVIFDVSSIKQPVKDELLNLKEKGCKVTSLHPMFGPSVRLLFGKHLIRTSLGVKAADELVDKVFSSTSLQILDMSFEEHDEVISVLLSLCHLVSIVFASTLKECGYDLAFLERFSSPTFSNLLKLSRTVHEENPNLYFEIQALNPNSPMAHDKLARALSELIDAVQNFNENKFVDIMTKSEKFLINRAKSPSATSGSTK